MGNDSTKTKSSKGKAKPVVASSGGKTLDSAKNVLLLYHSSSEITSDIIDYFCDALNQANPPGCVVIESKNAVDLSGHNAENIRDRVSQWLTNHSCVTLLWVGREGLSRENFVDDNGKLPSKIFPVCLGSEASSDWPEVYSLGIANIEKIDRPNDFEGGKLDTLVAAIRGVQ